MMIEVFISIFIGYLIGSFPTGYIAGKWIAKIDLRDIGSGSTGATNVLRHVGKKAASIVFLIDVLKGFLPVILARSFLSEDLCVIFAGLAALAGHIWPIWLQWKGGKAVATGLGFFLGLSWSAGLASFGTFLLVISISKIVSLASICAAISLPLFMILSFENNPPLDYLLVSFIAMLMVLWRHRSNLKRLIKNKEPRINI